MEEFSCGRCYDVLEELQVAGAALERCPQCGSLFYESPDFSRVVMSKKPVAALAMEPVTCPRCGIDMEGLPAPVEGGFVYQLCGACHGLWLDARELARLEKARFQAAGETAKDSEGRRRRAASVMEAIENHLLALERQRQHRLATLEDLVTSGLSDAREIRMLKTLTEAEATIGRQALGRSPLFEEARRSCIEGLITGAQFEAIRERLTP